MKGEAATTTFAHPHAAHAHTHTTHTCAHSRVCVHQLYMCFWCGAAAQDQSSKLLSAIASRMLNFFNYKFFFFFICFVFAFAASLHLPSLLLLTISAFYLFALYLCFCHAAAPLASAPPTRLRSRMRR